MAKAQNTAVKKAAFLAAFMANGNQSASAEAVDVDRTTPPRWAREDEAFADEWDSAKEVATDRLIKEARRRAEDGVSEPVYQGGELVGHKQKYSDVLLIFLLKGLKPEMFRDRHEFTGKDGGPIEIDDVGRYRQLLSTKEGRELLKRMDDLSRDD